MYQKHLWLCILEPYFINMGFYWTSMKTPEFSTVIKSLTDFLLQKIKFIVMMPLYYLSPSQQEAPLPPPPPAASESSGHVLILDGSSSPTLVPLHVLTSLIKQKLPVTEFSKFLERSKGSEEEKEGIECCVCLNRIEGREIIRETSNCGHIFHSQCLDRWVDQNQLTCPLCRTMLFPGILGQNTLHHY